MGNSPSCPACNCPPQKDCPACNCPPQKECPVAKCTHKNTIFFACSIFCINDLENFHSEDITSNVKLSTNESNDKIILKIDNFKDQINKIITDKVPGYKKYFLNLVIKSNLSQIILNSIPITDKLPQNILLSDSITFENFENNESNNSSFYLLLLVLLFLYSLYIFKK
jgi:hypothetical protein